MSKRIFVRPGFTVYAVGVFADNGVEVSIFDARSNSYSHILSTKDVEALRTSITTWLRDQKRKKAR
jgi:hypothetical protein